jgi:plasmid replication initiation protein
MGKNVTDVGLDSKGPQHELKKHAATIHCSNSLTLLQRKISNALLYHAYKELLQKEEHEITIKQLCRLIGYSGNNHSAIKDALKGMLSTVIEWNVVSDTTGEEDWTASSMLASVSLRGPICLFAYSPRMKQLLHSPSMFGKINLFIQSRFKSSYGLALYENCIRYRGLPHTKWFEIDMFRKLMGVPDDKYTIFRDFKRRVVDKSVEEVNTYSDLIVEPDYVKDGRQVGKIRFLLKERAKKVRLGVPSEDAADELDTLKNQLSKIFGLTTEQVEQVLSEYEPAFIMEKIAIIESSKNYQEGRVHNLVGYFLSALKNNYQVEKSSAEVKLVRKIKETEQHLQQKESDRVLEQTRNEYQAYREAMIDEAVDALNQSEYTELLEAFHEHAATNINTVLRLQKNKYTRETVIHSPQIKAQMRQFALQRFSELQGEMISFEEFMEKTTAAKQVVGHQFQMLEEECES